MNNKEKILYMLNIERSEFKTIALIIVIQFLSGVALSIFYIAISATFIHEVPIEKLYIVFIAASFLIILFNYLYGYLEHHYGVAQTYYVTLIFSTLSLCGFYFALVNENHVAIIAIFSAFYLIYFLNSMSFWGVASQIYSVRESKRLFPIMSSGDLVSKLAGYLLAGILFKLILLKSLLLLSMIFFALANIFLAIMLKNNKEKIASNEHSLSHHAKSSENKAVKEEKKLMFSICSLGLLCSIAVYFSEYLFLDEIKASDQYTEEIAQLLAIILASGRLLALFFKVIFSAKIEEKLGLRRMLSALPIFVFLSMILYFFISNYDQSLYFLCIYIVIFEGIKLSAYDPYYFAMFQVLSPAQRLKGHARAKGFFEPMGQLITGGLILFGLFITEDSFLKSVSIGLITLALLWLIIIKNTNKKYYRYINELLIKYSLFNEKSISIISNKTIEDKLKERIELLNNKDSYFSVQYIYQLNPDFSRSYFLSLLDKKPPDNIIQFIIRKAQENGWSEYRKISYFYIQNDSSNLIKNSAVRFLASLSQEDFYSILDLINTTHRDDLLSACIDGGLKNKNQAVLNTCIALIPDKLSSPHVADKIDGLKWIRKLNKRWIDTQIISSMLPLLETQDKELKEHLIITIKSLKNPVFLPYLFSQLKQNKYASSIRECLATYSDHWIGMLQADPSVTTPLFVTILTKSKAKKSKKYLISLFYKSDKYHEIIVPYLIRNNFQDSDKKIIRQMILDKEIKLAQILSLIHKCNNSQLKSALINEKYKELLLIIGYLHFIQPISNLHDLTRILEKKQQQYYDFLIEQVELMLQEFKLNKVVHLFEKALLFVDDATDFESEEAIAEQIIKEKKHHYSPWLIAVALYFYPAIKNLVNPADYKDDPLISEILRT